MRERQDMAKSRSGDAFVVMAMRGGLPMIMEEDTEVVDRFMVVCRSVVEDDLILSIVIRVCFVHGFCLI